jgi:hypothetical protein
MQAMQSGMMNQAMMPPQMQAMQSGMMNQAMMQQTGMMNPAMMNSAFMTQMWQFMMAQAQSMGQSNPFMYPPQAMMPQQASMPGAMNPFAMGMATVPIQQQIYQGFPVPNQASNTARGRRKRDDSSDDTESVRSQMEQLSVADQLPTNHSVAISTVARRPRKYENVDLGPLDESSDSEPDGCAIINGQFVMDPEIAEEREYRKRERSRSSQSSGGNSSSS